jgi:hypothetical protein
MQLPKRKRCTSLLRYRNPSFLWACRAVPRFPLQGNYTRVALNLAKYAESKVFGRISGRAGSLNVRKLSSEVH